MRLRTVVFGLAAILCSTLFPIPVAAAAPGYSFDSAGRLASATNELGTTRYKYFEDGSIAEMVDPGGRRYVFREGDAPASWATFSPNFLPSLARAASASGGSANPFAFTGFLYERELGLYLTPSGRLYDPTIGRFVQQDSHLGTLTDPPSLHRYLYGHANPARFIDPTGHEDKDANGLAAAMNQMMGVFASDHRPPEQRPEWYNVATYVYHDLPPRLLPPMRQMEGLARQDGGEFASATAETVAGAAVPTGVKALVERFPILGRSVTEVAKEGLDWLKGTRTVPVPTAPAPPVRTVPLEVGLKSSEPLTVTENGLAPTIQPQDRRRFAGCRTTTTGSTCIDQSRGRERCARRHSSEGGSRADRAEHANDRWAPPDRRSQGGGGARRDRVEGRPSRAYAARTAGTRT